jgi:hypothetical protein
MSDHKSPVLNLTYSPKDAIDARKELFSLMQNYPASEEETERSLGLFLRGSLLARFLAIGEVYQKIVDLPGIIIDLGTWRGQTAVLCENYRAIYEPLHFNRRIVALDTFEGYKGFSDKDKTTELHGKGMYALGGTSYVALLERILNLHERCNAMGHFNGKHRVVAGDCRVTLPEYFEAHPSEVVALAFFDLGCFEPTLDAFNTIYSRLVPGGVLAFWQLTRGEAIEAEGKVYFEHILNSHRHEIARSKAYPGLCYLTKK